MNATLKRTYHSIIVVCLFVIGLNTPLSAGIHGPQWGYSGSSGPEHWGTLAPEFVEFGKGAQQSPVDIRGAVPTRQAPIDYRYESTPLKIVNNGHTVQVNDASSSHALLGGKRYKLLQFHFHSPSENALNGKRYPMEAHLVHKDDQGNLGVISVFMKEGAHNPVIDSLWIHVSGEVNHEASYPLPVSANKLLPANSDYYHFQGSLTTPPCTEGVSWYVLKTPIEVSKDQIQQFVSVIGHNARPQPNVPRTVRLTASRNPLGVRRP